MKKLLLAFGLLFLSFSAFASNALDELNAFKVINNSSQGFLIQVAHPVNQISSCNAHTICFANWAVISDKCVNHIEYDCTISVDYNLANVIVGLTGPNSTPAIQSVTIGGMEGVAATYDGISTITVFDNGASKQSK